MVEVCVLQILLGATALCGAAVVELRRGEVDSSLSGQSDLTGRLLEALNVVVQTASADSTLDEVFDAAWRAAQEAGACCCIWSSRYGEQRAELLRTRSDGLTPEHALAALGDCEATREARRRSAPIVAHPSGAEGTSADRLLAEAGLTWVFATPVTAAGAPVGDIAFATRAEGGFDDVSARFLKSLADILGGAHHRDVLKRHGASEAGLHKELADGVPAMLIAIDANGVITLFNQAAEEVTGLRASEVLGRSSSHCFEAMGAGIDVGALVQRAFTAPNPITVRTRLRRGGRRELTIEWRLSRLSAPRGQRPVVLAAGADITERRRVEEELTRSERLSATGQLVAGVAHELNNPLTAVVGLAELLEEEVGSEPARGYAKKLLAQAMRSRRIVSGLLNFAREETPGREPVEINDVIAQTLDLVGYQLEVQNVEIVTELSTDLPPVFADPGELQQVFVNLLINAQHALAQTGGGRVAVRTDEEEGYVRATVTDNGPGIREDVLPTIFKAFVTTKPEGMGTGLGLSISQGIVERHDGTISAANRAEGGAVFTVLLPKLAAPAVTFGRGQAGATKRERAPSVVKSARLLIIDDEEPVRMVMKQALVRAGHEADEADDGHAALELIAQQDYDLIICDLRMPGVSGEDLYEQILVTRPDLAERVMFSTGDVGSDQVRQFLAGTGLRYVEKPFTTKQFLAVVEAALGSE